MKLHLKGCPCCPAGELFCNSFTDGQFGRELIRREVDSMLADMRVREDDATTGESGGDEWLTDELLLAALLATLVFERAKPGRDDLLPLLTVNPDMGRVMDAIDRLDDDMAGVVDKAARAQIDAAIARAINIGALQIPNGAISPTPADVAGLGTVMEVYPSVTTAAASIAGTTAWTADNFWSRFLGPALRREIERTREATPPPPPVDLRPVQLYLDNRLKGTAYWDLVANAGASRAYHYGYAKTARINGYLRYRFVAVMDDRTTEICRAMSGKVFEVQSALDIMEAGFAATEFDPLAIADFMPWPSESEAPQILASSSAALAAAGILIPPMHPYCRSTIQVI